MSLNSPFGWGIRCGPPLSATAGSPTGEGTVGVSQSAGLITGPVAESAPVLVIGGIRGIEFERQAVIGDRGWVVSELSCLHESAVEEGVGKSGIQCNGLVVVCDCSRQVVQLKLDSSPVVVGGRISGIEVDRLVVIAGGASPGPSSWSWPRSWRSPRHQWGAKPVNVEFRFTPYLPGPKDAELVTTLAGVLELEPLLRRGDNLLRLRFTPKDGAMPYRSQFRWMVVDDQTTTSTTAMGSLLTTNLGALGGDDREARGPVAVQQEYQAPFARVEPWQDAPAVTALSPDDRAAILELVRRRADLFAPDFSAAYRHLASHPKDRGVSLDVPEARRLGCPEAD